jgi:hypothetical protein
MVASNAASDAQLGAILGLYAAAHGAVMALELVALATRSVHQLASVAAAAGALLAWLVVGLMDALGPSFPPEPELIAIGRAGAAVSLSFAVLTFLAKSGGGSRPGSTRG